MTTETKRTGDGHKENWVFMHRTFNRGKMRWSWRRLGPEGTVENGLALFYDSNIVRKALRPTAKPGAIYEMTVDYGDGEVGTRVNTQGADVTPLYVGVDDTQDYTVFDATDRTAALEQTTWKRQDDDVRRNLVREALAPIHSEYQRLGRTGRAAFLALVIDEVMR